MTDTERTPIQPGLTDRYMEGPKSYGSDDNDDWNGWISFAGIMMILLGGIQIIEGLVGILRPDYYLVGSEGLVVSLSFTGWGWVHLVLGILVLAAGYGVFAGKTWGRVVGVVLAGLSLLVNLVFIAAYPLWAIIIIAIDVAVIAALCSNNSRWARA